MQTSRGSMSLILSVQPLRGLPLSSCGRSMKACNIPRSVSQSRGEKGGRAAAGSIKRGESVSALLQLGALESAHRLTPLEWPPMHRWCAGLGSSVRGGLRQRCAEMSHTTHPSQLVPNAALITVGVQPGEDGPLPCAGGLVEHKAGGQQHVV